MKKQLQKAWQDYCSSTEDRIDQHSFIAGWEACEVHAARSIDELAYIGRQVAQGVPQELAEAELHPPSSHAA